MCVCVCMCVIGNQKQYCKTSAPKRKLQKFIKAEVCIFEFIRIHSFGFRATVRYILVISNT